MNNFWDNVYKFPRFLISVIIGFILTTLYPIFKLLKSKKSRFILTLSILILGTVIYKVIKLMLGAS